MKIKCNSGHEAATALSSPEFQQMLDAIEGGAAFIEFGGETERLQDAVLRIYSIPTPGGVQFSIKQIGRFGVEGSGEYIPLRERTLLIARLSQRLHTFFEPHPNRLIRDYLAKKADRAVYSLQLKEKEFA